ncbi:MAG: hypothetical protein IIW73_02175 [Clostridia bacterium]|nr:hypothetical protein [Clostridia bacterium]
MMWHCNDCGQNHYYDEIVVRRDTDTKETSITCPSCGSDNLTEAEPCEVCGECYPIEDLYGYNHRVCRDCIERKNGDIDFFADVGKESGCDVEYSLNSFLASFFSKEELEDLMIAELKNRASIRPVDCSEYLKYNMEDAADVLAEE